MNPQEHTFRQDILLLNIEKVLVQCKTLLIVMNKILDVFHRLKILRIVLFYYIHHLQPLLTQI